MELVPSISISYHGTKSEGIFKNMGVAEFVVKEYDYNVLINQFNKLFLHSDKCKDILKNKLSDYQAQMKMDFTKIFNDK